MWTLIWILSSDQWMCHMHNFVGQWLNFITLISSHGFKLICGLLPTWYFQEDDKLLNWPGGTNINVKGDRLHRGTVLHWYEMMCCVTSDRSVSCIRMRLQRQKVNRRSGASRNMSDMDSDGLEVIGFARWSCWLSQLARPVLVKTYFHRHICLGFTMLEGEGEVKIAARRLLDPIIFSSCQTFPAFGTRQ